MLIEKIVSHAKTVHAAIWGQLAPPSSCIVHNGFQTEKVGLVGGTVVLSCTTPTGDSSVLESRAFHS